MGIISRHEINCNFFPDTIVSFGLIVILLVKKNRLCLESKMDTKKLQQMIRIAKLYYELGWGQIDIA